VTQIELKPEWAAGEAARSFSPAQIVPAGWRDIWAVNALEHTCFGPDAWSLLEIGWTLAFAPVRLKAAIDGRLAGFVAGEIHRSENAGWIATIAVLPSFQRRGLGRQLLQAAEAAFKLPIIKLTVRVTNQPALTLYKQMGYTITNRLPRYYSGGEDGFVMEKRR